MSILIYFCQFAPDLQADENEEKAKREGGAASDRLALLMEMMSEEEIRAAAMKVIEELGATGQQDMGRVMGKLMPELKGKADGRLVSAVVGKELAS